METTPQENFDEFFAFFANRLIAITGIACKGSKEAPGEPSLFCFSGMMMSFDGDWYFVTAGHCLRDLDAIHETSKVDALSFIDSLGSEAIDNHRIPIVNYPEMFRDWTYKVGGFDCGFIKINDYYKQLFMANNIRPIDESQWRRQPNREDFTSYHLLGTPHAFLDGVELDISFLKPIL